MGHVANLWLLNKNGWRGFEKTSLGNFITIAVDLNPLIKTRADNFDKIREQDIKFTCFGFNLN